MNKPFVRSLCMEIRWWWPFSIWLTLRPQVPNISPGEKRVRWDAVLSVSAKVCRRRDVLSVPVCVIVVVVQQSLCLIRLNSRTCSLTEWNTIISSASLHHFDFSLERTGKKPWALFSNCWWFHLDICFAYWETFSTLLVPHSIRSCEISRRATNKFVLFFSFSFIHNWVIKTVRLLHAAIPFHFLDYSSRIVVFIFPLSVRTKPFILDLT